MAGQAGAQDLSLPAGAALAEQVTRDPGVLSVPTGPWRDELGIPTQRVEGRVTVQAWRLPGSGLTPFQLAQPLRDQLTALGYDIVLDCAARRCGGFDFRFGIQVLPAPEMYVDLTAYHFISALSPEGSAVTVLASRDDRAGYVQIMRAGADAPAETRTDSAPVNAAPAEGIGRLLETQGHAVLTDLEFETGSASLGGGAVASLDDIAAYLRENPSRRILFVGHTDATGSLEANQAISLRRAQAAETYLRDRHGIDAARIGADGVGYLAPRASNLTEAGREANRRVEAVLISTE